MKKTSAVILSLGLVFGFSTTSATNADAASASAVKKFSNCKEMNKTYKGGVARTSKVKNKGGKTNYKPYVSKALYDANKGRDRDKDLIACER